jgi:hypothetical protein
MHIPFMNHASTIIKELKAIKIRGFGFTFKELRRGISKCNASHQRVTYYIRVQSALCDTGFLK